MLFVKYFNSCILFVCMCLLTKTAVALTLETKCGEYIFQVEILGNIDIYELQYKLFYQGTDKKKKLFYKTELGVSLEAACIQNKEKKFLMLFQETCGGNGCPEDIYGIYDPDINRVLINPNDWPKGNSQQIEKILGYRPTFLDKNDDKSFFCCSTQLSNFRFGR